ncbi:MAG: hypothetical protein ACLQDC_11225 [Verrucomicrobiia bacterium]
MKRLLVSVFLLAAVLVRADQTDPKVVVGKARFTVVAPECIRIEYAKDGRFVDAKSMFAVGRDAGWRDFKLTRDGSNVTIDTGKIRLQYRPDDETFNQGNLRAHPTSMRQLLVPRSSAAKAGPGHRRVCAVRAAARSAEGASCGIMAVLSYAGGRRGKGRLRRRADLAENSRPGRAVGNPVRGGVRVERPRA